jgi:hypothetical protein
MFAFCGIPIDGPDALLEAPQVPKSGKSVSPAGDQNETAASQ